MCTHGGTSRKKQQDNRSGCHWLEGGTSWPSLVLLAAGLGSVVEDVNESSRVQLVFVSARRSASRIMSHAFIEESETFSKHVRRGPFHLTMGGGGG